MLKQLSSMAAILCLIGAGTQAFEGNPLKNAKVGDFASFKMSTKAGGMSMDMETKRTIIGKTDAEVTMEIVTKVMGRETKINHTVKLNEDFDPRQMAFRGKGDVTFKELDKGEETITVAGKALKTTWTSFEATSKQGTMKGKAWVCPDVPLGGLVKSEMDMGGLGTMTSELVDYGSAK